MTKESKEVKENPGFKENLATWRYDHRLAIMIGSAIIASLGLVAVSMWLYNTSGAAQLDLSRPGYSSVRDQALSDDSIDAFPGSGPLTPETLSEFSELFGRYADEATTVDAFGGDVLSDSELGIDEPKE